MDVKQKKGILLITAGFPFGESEQSFLRAEFAQLCKAARVTLLAVNTQEPMLYPIPEDVQAERYFQTSLLHGKIWNSIPKLFHKKLWQELNRASSGCSIKLFAERFRLIVGTYLNACNAKDVLEQIIQRDAIDMIYTYWCTDMTVAALMLKKTYPQLKVVTRFHGIDLYNERQSARWQPFRSWITEQADKLVFACEAGKRYYESCWAEQAKEKTMLSYLGCRSMERLPCQKREELCLVSCSNLIPLKRVHLIIEALALLPETVSVAWYHIGDGSQREILEKNAEVSLSHKKNVRWGFMGAVPNKDLESVYKQIQPDVFLSASSTEGGTPVSIQEAFAMGIPAIAADAGGTAELVCNAQTGYLLPLDLSAGDICCAIEIFAAMPQAQRTAMADAAYALWSDHFHAEKNAAAFVSYLCEIIN